jgi:putative transposon-encoded protein
MINIDSTTAKKLVMKTGYEMVYTERVRTNGGNSGKINCKKEFIDNEVVVFVLRPKESKKFTDEKGGE